MRRVAIDQLYEWKNRSNRKPLILQGARQVGKTWLMRDFAEKAYDKFVYVNFEDDDTLKMLFATDFDIERILTILQWKSGIKIDDGTLIIFDEIQEAPRGLTALKYFYEKAPHLHVIAAGSLLGITMHRKDSFPVGKVEFMTLYPLTFVEFLEALGEGQMIESLLKRDWGIITTFRARYEERLRQYYYVGGMPEVVLSFVEQKDLQVVRQLQNDIIESYEHDFSKHAPTAVVPRIRMVWNSIPAQLAKENRKFIYGLIKEGARAKDFELAIEWLRDAGLIYKVNRAKKGMLPLSAYEDFAAFKIFMFDVGLMTAMSRLPTYVILDNNALLTQFRGALTEQYVLQELKAINGLDIFYWSADNSRGELDFLVQNNNSRVIPIEVKAEENLQSKSLRVFVEKNPGLKGVRLSMSPYREQDWLINYPLYAASLACID